MQSLREGLSVIAVCGSDGLTPSIAVGGGAEAYDGGTAIDQQQTMTLLL